MKDDKEWMNPSRARQNYTPPKKEWPLWLRVAIIVVLFAFIGILLAWRG
jgi:hypothetical protein